MLRRVSLLVGIFGIFSQLLACGGGNGDHLLTETTDLSHADTGFVGGKVDMVTGGVCGASGTVTERRQDCATQKCIRVQPTGSATVPCDEQHDFVWDLVVRTTQKNEVWRDQDAKLLWSDDSLFVVGNQPTLLAFCEDPEQGKDVKGSLLVSYRLPTLDEYKAAESHGIRSVLRSIEAVLFWASTLYGGTDAWYFADGELKHMNLNNADEYFRAHCVAQSN